MLPAIHRKILELIKSARKSDAHTIVEAAILIETGLYRKCDVVWTVEVPIEVAVTRLETRNNLSREDALKRIQSQISNKQRAAKSNFVIQNNGSLMDLHGEVKTAVLSLRAKL